MTTSIAPTRSRAPVPRGLATRGPAILSYGFRPFFLMAGLVALLDMVLWIGALTGFWSVGGASGPIDWHAHEMLFGYTTAALCGFVLTAVPNWTGRLPVSGMPLLGLVVLWIAGRLVMLAPWALGETASGIIDWLFLFTLAAIAAIEVIVGKNWQNLRVVVGVGLLAVLNGWFHVATLAGWDTMIVVRFTVSTYLMLVSHIGGRIVPSFTRNWLARHKMPLPRPAGRLDNAALLATLAGLLAWSIFPEWAGTVVLNVVAAALHIATTGVARMDRLFRATADRVARRIRRRANRTWRASPRVGRSLLSAVCLARTDSRCDRNDDIGGHDARKSRPHRSAPQGLAAYDVVVHVPVARCRPPSAGRGVTRLLSPCPCCERSVLDPRVRAVRRRARADTSVAVGEKICMTTIPRQPVVALG